MRGIRAIYLTMSASIAAFPPFTAVALAARGFDAAAIGLVTAGQAAALMLAVPIWGHLGDVTLGRRAALFASALGGAIVIGAAGLPLPAVAFAVLVIVFALMQAAWALLADALALNAVRGQAGAYGRVRLLASLGFAIPVGAVGFIYDRTGYGPAAFLCAAAALGLAAAARGAPDIARADLAVIGRRGPARSDGRRHGGSFIVALRAQPRLWGLIAVALACHAAISAGFTYLPLRITDLGGQPSDVALSWSIGAFTEIPTMLASAAIVARLGLRGTVAASALGYAGCLLAWSVAPTPLAIVAVRAASGFCFAGVTVGLVLTASALLPRRLQATGQALYQLVAFGLAAVVANGAGGLLYTALGPTVFFTIAGGVAVLGAGLAMRFIPTRAAIATIAAAIQVDDGGRARPDEVAPAADVQLAAGAGLVADGEDGDESPADDAGAGDAAPAARAGGAAVAPAASAAMGGSPEPADAAGGAGVAPVAESAAPAPVAAGAEAR